MDASRRCARPGCHGGVTAWLSYDYARRAAWLDLPLGTTDGGHWGLCQDHADRLRVPLGWTCEDRRTAWLVSHPGPTAAPPLRMTAGRRAERGPAPAGSDPSASEAEFPAVAI